jgi:uncharacterized protein YbjT (DUF2867 family)
MKIKAIIFGSTGMIGQSVLRECLKNEHVESVLVINRQSCNISNPKLKEIIHQNFFDISILKNELSGYDACFFCLGISAAGLSEKDYHKITFDLTMSVAETLLNLNKGITFCYISAAGADRSEKGRIMWARVKGKTENALLVMPFKKAYMFRPGYIQPMHGIRSRTRLYNALYFVCKPLYFILKHFKNSVTSTEKLGKAMINAGALGYEKNILKSGDINKVAEESNH